MKSPSTNRLASSGPRRKSCRQAARAPERGRAVYALAITGFTLTEILVALALVLIIGALSAVDMSSVANGVNRLPPAQVLKATIRQGRFLAMSRMDTVILTFNGDTHSFDLMDDKGNILEKDPDGVDNPNANLTVTFTPILPLTDLVTDPGTQSDDDNQLSKLPSPRLYFHATGATEPMKVTLSLDNNDTKFNLDSFSEGPPPKYPEVVPALPPTTN